MRRTPALLIVCVAMLAGCATSSNPTGQWIEARESLTLAQDGTVVALDAGWIDEADLRELAPYINAAQQALDDAYLRLPDGGSTFAQLLASVRASIANMETRMTLGRALNDTEPEAE